MSRLRDILRAFRRRPSPEPVFVVPPAASVLPSQGVIFPGGIQTLHLSRPGEAALAKAAFAEQAPILVVLQKAETTAVVRPVQLNQVGTLCRVLQLEHVDADGCAVELHGVVRCRAEWFAQTEPYLKARIAAVASRNPDFDGIATQAEHLRMLALRLIERDRSIPKGAADLVASMNQPEYLVDLLAANLDMAVTEKQEVLEAEDLEARVALMIGHLERLLSRLPPALTVVEREPP